MNRFAVVLLPLFITGCAIPVPVKVAAWVVDGVSYVATEKSASDHVISAALKKDCAVWRGVTQGEFCREYAPEEGDTAVAGNADAATGNDEKRVAENADPSIDTGKPAARGEAAGLEALAAFDMAEAAPVGSARPVVFYVSRRDVNVRNAPRVGAGVIEPIPANEAVALVGQKNGWLLIDYVSSNAGYVRRGWVDGNYLEQEG